MTPSAALLLAVRILSWTGFLVLAARLSAKDWRSQKIEHADLRVGAALALGAYAVLLANSALGALGLSGTYHRAAFFTDLSIHFALSVAAGLGLWRARIWPAGDAKLFLLLAAMAPLLPREPDFQGGRLFLSALINIFLPACVFVFAQVAGYIWSTRLKHARGFLIQLGARRAPGLALDALRDAVASARRGAWEALLEAARHPLDAVLGLARWGASFVLMSGVSASLYEFVPSGAARMALCFAFLFLVMRAQQVLGEAVIWVGAAAAAAAYASSGADSSFRHEVARSLGALTVFGAFLQLGVMWTTGLLGGRLHWIFLPVIGMLLGSVSSLLGSAIGLFSQASQYLPLAAFGAFFGLCIVFVRIWEQEASPLIPLDALKSYMVPHDSFLEMVAEKDPDFRDRHLASAYADGFTPAQVKAVKAWCRRQDIPTVTIHTTMSFAFWIFLGYFLTWLLAGQVLSRVL